MSQGKPKIFSDSPPRPARKQVFDVILFVVIPFVSFLVSVFNFKDKNRRVYIYLFLILYGYGFFYWTGADAISISSSFVQMGNISWQQFFVSYLQGWTFATGLDLYSPVSMFVISRFTDDPSVFYAFHAAIYGFFMLGTIALVYDEFPQINRLAFIIIFIALFAMIHRVGFVRFYTAMWIFAYFAILYYRTGNWKYVVGAGLSILVHFSFIVPLVLLGIVVFRNNLISIYFGVFLLSLFIPQQLGNLIVEFTVSEAGDTTLDQRITSYTREGYLERRATNISQRVFYARYNIVALGLYFNVLMGIMYFIFIRYKIKDHIQLSLFSLSLLLVAFYNISTSTAGAAERYIIVAGLISLIMLYRHLCMYSIKINKLLVLITTFPLLYWSIMEIRILIDNSNFILYVGNLFLILFVENDESLLKTIQGLL